MMTRRKMTTMLMTMDRMTHYPVLVEFLLVAKKVKNNENGGRWRSRSEEQQQEECGEEELDIPPVGLIVDNNSSR
jgi:hypothetical protein